MTHIHPALSLVYYMAMFACTCCFDHPVSLGIVLVGALVQAALLGRLSGRFAAGLFLAAGLFAAAFACFCNFGVTPLGLSVLGNAVTAEGLAAGAAVGVRLICAALWFSGMTAVLTGEKMVGLCGRMFPRGSLFLALLLRLVPRTKEKLRRIRETQAGIGRAGGGLCARVSNSLRVWSILVTWLLESLPETAAAMKCRGYSLRGRSAYAPYRFEGRERLQLLTFAALGSAVLAGVLLDQTRAVYRPYISVNPVTGISYLFYGAELLFVLWHSLLAAGGMVRVGQKWKEEL